MTGALHILTIEPIMTGDKKMSMSIWKRKGNKRKKSNLNIPHSQMEQYKDDEINGNLEDTVDFIQSLLGDNDDFIIRRLSIYGTHTAVLFYFSNLVNQEVINHEILKPLMEYPDHIDAQDLTQGKILQTLSEQVLYQGELTREAKLIDIVDALLAGESALVIDGAMEAFHIDTRYVEKRAISQPETEQIIIGPRGRVY